MSFILPQKAKKPSSKKIVTRQIIIEDFDLPSNIDKQNPAENRLPIIA